ncbi:glycosyltransferase family 4 protein [Telmatospirillum siberiense]|uniref:glycosyltransferase family 4 protein n=1 Tax=Telmatospirillum siberiense TaxID=382514 RepID=UPI0013043CB1|nr:glycosyltransferase family 4 protein [Telmatospirillum siberiense]
MHDYAGHAFPFDLCKELASRGHVVQHLYFTQCQAPQATGGKGLAEGYRSRGLSIPGNFQKFSFIRRRFQEVEYGKVAARAIIESSPDVVISANTPIDSQLEINAACRNHHIPMVHWLQDVASVAMEKILPQKLPILGKQIARFYRFQEARMLRQSAAVVVITSHFLDICSQMGVARDDCHVIENWAPLNEIQPRPRRNAWSEEQGLTDKRVLLYSGTLGFKHNPAIFERLAAHFQSQPDVRIVVISEGMGAAWLAERKAALGLDNLILLPYQPYNRLSEVLGTGDLLLAILEESAGIFSVPSKVLSYLSAGKAILLSVPLSNLAAETVRRAEAGRVIAPRDVEGLIAAADDMLSDASMREFMGRHGRIYAEKMFDASVIADRFERVLSSVTPTFMHNGR